MFRRLAGFLGVLAGWFVFCNQGHAQLPARESRPNIVLILADDLGFSDIGCYGGEMLTPNLDKLAKGGLRFRQFYNGGRCCPSRASVLSGLYPHQAGVGHMMNDYRRPGYRGNLSENCATIAELLRAAGYQTMMVGKWHVSRYTAPEGPKFNWPLARGFELFYGTIHGAGSYFDPVTLTRQDHFVRATGEDYYYTDAISDRAVEYIEQAGRRQMAFFLYVAYTAPHWPLHAPQSVISRYRGKYAAGWDALRRQRHQRMISLKIVKRTWPLSPREGSVSSWEQAPHKSWQQRRMEVYAAQVDLMDQGIGRIMEKLRQVGAERNTLVMFLSDNGGCAEEVSSRWKGPHVPARTRRGRSVVVGNNYSLMPGPDYTYQSYGAGWASASNTPFRLFKHYVHEGGIATPMIAYWPAVIARGGGLTDQPAHVIDIMPTCLQVAKVSYPTDFGGYRLIPIEGKSLVPVFQGGSLGQRTLFWEHEGNCAIRDGKWKLVCRYPYGWELYDMEADRTETNDLAGEFPVIVKDLDKQFRAWGIRCHVEKWRK